ncbi:MAG: SDR family oxidoreductase [Hyphomicrobiales bacterium]|nr:SDR family oxidoreductase [Hyphomicrobiales bacterium]
MGQGGAVLVTGAARRIGGAIVERLARDGRAVAIHASARSLPEAERLAAEIAARGGRAVALAADLADPAQAIALISRAAAALGPLTHLVNNASIFELDTAADFRAEEFDRNMAINLRAPLLLAQAFAAALPADATGSIVNLIDQRVLRPDPHYFSYSISKAALWAATRTMAQAYAPRVRVNAVGPGPVLPNANEGQAAFDAEVAVAPLRRAVDLSEIADAVAWLMAAPGVTGQMIAVDAGQHLAWAGA